MKPDERIRALRAAVFRGPGVGHRIETVADPVCATCIADGTRWVSLRQCLECGHVGCCDSSIGKHASAHFHETLHPVMESAEPDESWRWCFVHNLSG